MERKGLTPKFCSECGQLLSKGVSYCTSCGTPVPVREGADFVADSPASEPRVISLPEVHKRPSFETVVESGKMDAVSEARADREAAERACAALYGDDASADALSEGRNEGSADDAASKKRKALFFGATAAVSAVVVGAMAFAGVFSGAPSDVVEKPSAPAVQQEVPSAAEEQAEPEKPQPVELVESYTTRFGKVNQVTYPAFSFGYPSGWTLLGERVSPNGESVDLRKDSDGTVVSFQQWSAVSHAGGASVEFVDTERLADASFVPGYVQANDLSSLGAFGVVRGTLLVNGEDNGIVYALLPDKALSDATLLSMASGLPGFDYSSPITFACMSDSKLSARTEQEVVAILASFVLSEKNAAVDTSGDYLLAESSSRVYSEAELATLTDHELYLARNEIFARYGRMFNNADLKAHFATKPWYSPRIAPEDFDESMLNSYEQRNVAVISKVEQSRGSAYYG